MISSPYFEDGKFDLYTESADYWYKLNNQSFTDSNYQFSGDIAFDPELQKCINVDIRYVLFIIDKYAGATNLIDEMTIVRE